MTEESTSWADLAWWHSPEDLPRPAWARSSQYVTMRDGARLAVDVFLPAAVPEAVPAILIQTRYFRRSRYHVWSSPLEPIFGRMPEVARFVAAGYAVVVVDVRGSGASFGVRTAEFSDDEVADGAEICDWIVAQSWCNGSIGGTGVSYEGSTAEHLLRTHHPGVKAAAIRYSLWESYRDIVVPGGVRNRWFLDVWSKLCEAMDRNEMEAFVGSLGGDGPSLVMSALTAGVAPVDDDADGRLLAAAVAEHRQNYSLLDLMRPVEFVDDERPDGSSLETFSPATYVDAIHDARAAVYSWCGWYDGAYAEAAVKRWRALADTGCRLVLGPWDHGNRQLPDPTTDREYPLFDYIGELLRFFDLHLKGQDTGIDGEAPVHYFTVGEGAWKAAHAWPPDGFVDTPLYFADRGALTWDPPEETDASDDYRVDFSTTTGSATRWQSQANALGVRIGWPDRSTQDAKLLVYDSPPLTSDVELTGNAVVDLHVAVDAEDSAFHVYLEEVMSDGEVRYVTEGLLRAVHRRLSDGPPAWADHLPYRTFARRDAEPLIPGELAELRFALLPISYLFQAGNRIRVALAGADADTFVRIPYAGPAPLWRVHRTASHPSHVSLPLQWRP